MSARLFGTAAAVIIGGSMLAGASTAAAAGATANQAADFTGILALNNCSGALVKVDGAQQDDQALAMTNGHCYEGGFLDPGQVIVDQPSNRRFDLLDSSGQNDLGTLQATKVSYATMTDTDVTIYELGSTYGEIQQRYDTPALEIAPKVAEQGEQIDIPSGYFGRNYDCSVDGFVYRLKEADWTWKNSIRYDQNCNTIHGTSGSPIVSTASGSIVGINNTGNDDGERCTLNNPCEVDENGNVTVDEGRSYGEQVHEFTDCIEGSSIALNRPECDLPKP